MVDGSCCPGRDDGVDRFVAWRGVEFFGVGALAWAWAVYSKSLERLDASASIGFEYFPAQRSHIEILGSLSHVSFCDDRLVVFLFA